MNFKKALLPAVLASAFLLRLGYGLAKPPQAPGQPLADPDGYVGLASSFAESWSFLDYEGKPSALREPVYPIALGLSFKAFGRRYGTLLFLHACLGTLALWLLFLIGRRLFGGSAALLAAAVGAVYPPFVFYAAQPLRETFIVFAASFTVWAMMRAAESRSLGGFAAAGLAGAAAGLTNTVFLPFCLLVPAVWWTLLDEAPGKKARRSAAYWVVLVLVYALWPARNLRVFHAWILGSTAGAGSTFYTYLVVPQEHGGTPRQQEILDLDPIVQGARGLDPAATERYYWKAGTSWVKEHPAAYARLVAWRLFKDQWRILPRERGYAHGYRLLKWASLLSDGWIIPLGFLGLLLFRLRPRELLWIYVFVGTTAGVYALVFTTLRYRLSMMPWLILLAAAALGRMFNAFPTMGTKAAAMRSAPRSL